MKTHTTLMITTLALGLCACATHVRPQGTRAPESAAPDSAAPVAQTEPAAVGDAHDAHGATTTSLLAPSEVVWSEATLALAAAPPQSPVTLELVVTRRSLVEAPLVLDVVVPAGATLVEGPARIETPNQAGEYRFTWVVSFDAVPQDDLVVHAQTVGDGFGFAAAPRYTFGRVTPEPTMPATSGPDRTLGNHRLGPTIPVGPPVSTTP